MVRKGFVGSRLIQHGVERGEVEGDGCAGDGEGIGGRLEGGGGPGVGLACFGIEDPKGFRAEIAVVDKARSCGIEGVAFGQDLDADERMRTRVGLTRSRCAGRTRMFHSRSWLKRKATRTAWSLL